MRVTESVLHLSGASHPSRTVPVFRFWILAAGALTIQAVRMIVRSRRAKDAVKLDSVSSDWLAQARGRDERPE